MEAANTSQSVLFSLSELSKIESERLAHEATEREAQRLRARAEALAREEDARRERERLDREERREAERAIEQRRREEREASLRLEESERRARVEAELGLQRERLAVEQARRDRRRPLVLGAVLGTLLLAGGSALLLHQLGARERQQRQLGDVLGQIKTQKQSLAAQRDKLRDLQAALNDRRDRLTKQALAALATASPTSAPAKKAHRGWGKKKGKGKIKRPTLLLTKCKDPTDPICGMTTRGQGY